MPGSPNARLSITISAYACKLCFINNKPHAISLKRRAFKPKELGDGQTKDVQFRAAGTSIDWEDIILRREIPIRDIPRTLN